MFPIKDDQPSYSTPLVNYFLIAVNILVFLFQATLSRHDGELLARAFGLVPQRLALFLAGSPRYTLPAVVLPFFTSMFLHARLAPRPRQLLVFVCIWGQRGGPFGALQVSGFLSGVRAVRGDDAVAVSPHSTLPMVGASGAIAGVLGAYFVLYPRARVLTWFFVFVIFIPAWFVLGEWFVMNFFEGAATLSMAQAGRDMGGVAFWAHVGGFVAGAVMIKMFPQRARRYPYAYR